MKKYFIISVFVLILISCSSGKNNKQIEKNKIQALITRILEDSLSFDEKVELMNNSIFDSLPFEQKKAFIIELTESSGWKADSMFNEKTRDSIFQNTQIKEYIKLYWLTNELDTSILK